MFTGMNLLTFIDIILWILLTGTITNLPFTLERARVDFNLKWSVVLLCKGHAETLIESPLRNAEAFSTVPLNRIKSIWIRKKKNPWIVCYLLTRYALMNFRFVCSVYIFFFQLSTPQKSNQIFRFNEVCKFNTNYNGKLVLSNENFIQ
jgi:hypothetical protein